MMTDETHINPEVHHRTISDDDAKAIASALLAEATRQMVMATGRGVWSSFKALLFPLLIAALIYLWAWQGKAVDLPAILPIKGA